MSSLLVFRCLQSTSLMIIEEALDEAHEYAMTFTPNSQLFRGHSQFTGGKPEAFKVIPVSIPESVTNGHVLSTSPHELPSHIIILLTKRIFIFSQ